MNSRRDKSFFLFLTMVFTQEQFSSWNVDVLKKYLAERGVPLGGGFRKDDLVKKCMYAQELQVESSEPPVTSRR